MGGRRCGGGAAAAAALRRRRWWLANSALASKPGNVQAVAGFPLDTRSYLVRLASWVRHGSVCPKPALATASCVGQDCAAKQPEGHPCRDRMRRRIAQRPSGPAGRGTEKLCAIHFAQKNLCIFCWLYQNLPKYM